MTTRSRGNEADVSQKAEGLNPGIHQGFFSIEYSLFYLALKIRIDTCVRYKMRVLVLALHVVVVPGFNKYIKNSFLD